MQELTPRIITILQKYMRDPAALVENSTTLSELEIDLLDLPMIFLDIEDVFGVQISYDDQIEDFATVRGLIACVASRLEVKVLYPRPRTSVPRTKRNWISTGAGRRS
jgi:acyl carrier protein